MSCDYQRDRIWQGFRSWYQHNVPAAIRDEFENAIEDYVTDWITETLENEGERAVGGYRKRRRKGRTSGARSTAAGGKKTSQRNKRGREQARPILDDRQRRKPDLQDPFERVYRLTKEIIVPGHIRWTADQRREMVEKMRHVMHWMRVQGSIPGANPIHGTSGVPRISSAASYAAVHDWLSDQGVDISSSFDPIHDAVWEDESLETAQCHELVELLERLEVERNKKHSANQEQEEELLHRILQLSPGVYHQVVDKFQKKRSLHA